MARKVLETGISVESSFCGQIFEWLRTLMLGNYVEYSTAIYKMQLQSLSLL